MRKSNLQSLLVLVVSIILLSSCGQVRQVTTSSNHKLHLIKADRNKSATAIAKVESPKAIENKELKALPEKDQDVSALPQEKKSVSKVRPATAPMSDAFSGKESKTKSKIEGSNKNLQGANKVLDHFSKINKAMSPNSLVEKLLPYGHGNSNTLLFLWIGCIVLAIIFYVVAYAAASGGSLGGLVIFAILAYLLWLAGVVLFIVWLVKMFS